MEKFIIIVFCCIFFVGCGFEERLFVPEQELPRSEVGRLISPARVSTQKSLVTAQGSILRSPVKQQKLYFFIRNDAKINLTFAIRRLGLGQKALTCSTKLLAMFKNQIFPELKLNRERNRDITLGRCLTRIGMIESIWAAGLTKKQKKQLLEALSGTTKLIDIPTTAKRDILLDTKVITNSLFFLQGISDALQPYAHMASSQKETLQHQNLIPEKRIPREKASSESGISSQKQSAYSTIPIHSPKNNGDDKKHISSPMVKTQGIANSPEPKSNLKIEPKLDLTPKIKINPEIKLDPKIDLVPKDGLKIFGD